MPFANYTQLLETATRYMDRTDRTTELDDFLRLIEADVSRRLNLRAQDKTATGTLTGGSSTLLTPVGILHPRQLVFDTTPPRTIDIVSLNIGEEIEYAERGNEAPFAASIHGVNATYQTQILVWPPPTGDVAYTLRYTDAVTPLTAAAPVNYLLTVHPDVYHYGLQMHSALFDEDDVSMARWDRMYQGAMDQARKIEWRSRATAGRLRVRADVGAP